MWKNHPSLLHLYLLLTVEENFINVLFNFLEIKYINETIERNKMLITVQLSVTSSNVNYITTCLFCIFISICLQLCTYFLGGS